MTPERKAELLDDTRAVMTRTAGTSDDAKAAVYPLAVVVEALLLEVVPVVRP